MGCQMADDIERLVEENRPEEDRLELEGTSLYEHIEETAGRWIQYIHEHPIILRRTFRVQAFLVLLVNISYIVYWSRYLLLKKGAPVLVSLALSTIGPDEETYNSDFMGVAVTLLTFNACGFIILLLSIIYEHSSTLQCYWVVFELMPTFAWSVFALIYILGSLAAKSDEQAQYYKMYGLLHLSMVFRGVWACLVIYNYSVLCPR